MKKEETKEVKATSLSLIESIDIEDIIDHDTAIQQVNSEIKKYQKYSDELIVNDETTKTKAADLFNQLKSFEKQLEEQRKEFVDPFNKIVKKANEKIKSITNVLSKIRGIIGGKLTSYQMQLEEAKRKQDEKNREKIEAAAEKGRQMPVIKTVQVQKTIETSNGDKLIFKDKWNGEIINLGLFVKWILDNNQLQLIEIKKSELNKIANFYKDTKQVDGLKITLEKIPMSYI